NLSASHSGRIKSIYDQAVKQHLSDYMGLVFEKMCREYLMRYETDPKMIIREVGQWWGNDGKKKKEIQIDIVGVPAEGKEYIIGSCKYRNEKVGIAELERLREYADAFGYGEAYHYYIFSKGGFTEELKQQEKQGYVKLIALEELYS
ncbi:MAG: ATP-binding protein, partial [Clostridia bacterium]|nr:ATP-binding protein [Clostridia bacterium]